MSSTQKEFDRQVAVELTKIRTEIPRPIGAIDEIVIIWERVTNNIAIELVNAGWSDSREYYSIYKKRDNLKMFLAGIEYHYNSTLPKEYVSIIADWKKENDPEYAKYLELKKKFGE